MVAAHQFVAAMHDLQEAERKLYPFRADYFMSFSYAAEGLGFAQRVPVLGRPLDTVLEVTPLGEEFNTAFGKIQEGFRDLHKVLDKIP